MGYYVQGDDKMERKYIHSEQKTHTTEKQLMLLIR